MITMNLDEELWRRHQYQMLMSFVHHLGYYRVLGRLYVGMNRKSEFWKGTIDAHLLRAILDWCMVGTDSSHIHWKKVVLTETAQSEFRQRLLSIASLTPDQWDAYWLDMTKFRNEYAAHRVAGSYPTTPKMDNALPVAITYDQWIRKRIRESSNAIFEEPSLRERYDKVTRTSKKFLKQLIALGPTVDQEYEGSPPWSN